MRGAVIGIVIGLVVGVVIGATVIAPRSTSPHQQTGLGTAEHGNPPAPLLPAKSKPSVHWKMASAFPASLPLLGTLAKRLEKKIWRISGGEIKIKFFAPEALVPSREIFDAVASGAIDAAFSSPGLWSGKIPALQLFAAVPFGPGPVEYMAWIYFGGGRELFEEIYRKNGLHGVFCGLSAPEAGGWFRKPIHVLEDFKGLNMRILGLGAKVMEKLGVVTNGFSEGNLFMALESGTIDATEFSMPVIDLKMGFHEMSKHYYFPGWHQPSTFFDLMINLQKWDALSSIAKSRIEAVCGDNVRHGLAESEAKQFPALKKFTAKGIAIHRWPAEIMEALDGAWQKVAAEEAAADDDFRRVWNSLTSFRKNYAIWRELSEP
ncbi:MAG TPA: TRAP transporter substrate-binding protein [Rhodospirillales bacterium]|jgi:TRAP-type mannitol/chloroaromatic compound transport system substrate-binding protein|nr:TRAP transporter substrate-binding protein [Rhodospirillales bacterium]